MRGETGVAYGRDVELEAGLDEGPVEDEVEGGKGEEGEDEEGKQNIWWDGQTSRVERERETYVSVAWPYRGGR